MSTIFQKIIAREIPANIVYEDEEILAFEDIAPQAPIHLLIIPKKPIPSMAMAEEEDAELLGKLLLVGASLARERGVSEQGYRLINNCNEYGGQTVFHLHFHLLAGRRLGWP
jgi:histidine triad (HIT) family protein